MRLARRAVIWQALRSLAASTSLVKRNVQFSAIETRHADGVMAGAFCVTGVRMGDHRGSTLNHDVSKALSPSLSAAAKQVSVPSAKRKLIK